MITILRANRPLSILVAALIILAISLSVWLSRISQESENVEVQAQELQDSLSVSELELKSSKATQEAQLSNFAGLETAAAIQEVRLEGWRSQANKAAAELEELKEVNDCQDITSINPDYQSNSRVAESLKEWIGDNYESVTFNEWDVVFSNSKTTNHFFSGDFGYRFIVYFDDPEFDTTNSVFWLNRGCWLDR